MKSRKFIALALSLIVVFTGFSPRLSNATCVSGDVKGFWLGVGSIGNLYWGEYEAMIKCKIVTNFSGTVLATYSSCYYRDGASNNVYLNIIGGNLRVGSTCAVSGYVTTTGGVRWNVQYGYLSSDKNSVSLGIYNGQSPRETLILNAHKL